MSLIPAFEIGIWNAWIFMVGYFLPYFLWILTKKGKEVSNKMKDDSIHVKHEKIITGLFMMILVVGPLYSIFLPIKLWTIWFYLGLSIFVFAELMYISFVITANTTPIDKPFTTGLYRYSRHPVYIMQFLMFLSISIACLSWVFLLFTVIIGISQQLIAPAEEINCIKKYGEYYRKYMEKTPRWIGIPKSSKK